MGAVSSNIVNAVESVTNSIQSTSSATTNEIATCTANINLNQCDFKEKAIINDVCTVTQTSNNIVNAIRNDNLNNTLSQKLAQEAASTVGALGLGFAEATNTANVFANSTNAIANSVTTTANQSANSNFNFNCFGGNFEGGLELNIQNKDDFLSTQVLKDQEVNNVINNISQDITQKATATVAGLTGLIIALAILIGVIGWVLFRPLEVAFRSQVFVLILFILIIIAIVITMYYFNAPPFFNPPITCIPIQSSIGKCASNIECVLPQKATISVPSAPLRYAYNIIGQGDTTFDPTNNFVPGLLQMAIAGRGGWATAPDGSNVAHNYFDTDPKKPANMPNPLYKDGNVWRTNIAGDNGWAAYIQNPDNAATARFYLANDLGLDTYAIINENEQCLINGEVKTGYTDCYQFKPDTIPPNLQNAIKTGGTVTGQFGSCNTNLYKTQRWLRIGALILLIIVIILFVLMMIFRKKGTTTGAQTVVTTNTAETKINE
jgi:energy-coupling factor transporter transmembrane protein EcfT